VERICSTGQLASPLILDVVEESVELLKNTVYLFEDTTQWLPKYVEREFKRLRIGESQKAVLKMLGQPIAKESHDNGKREIWRYTQGKIDSSYWFRMVVFDVNKMVSKIDHHYNVDSRHNDQPNQRVQFSFCPGRAKRNRDVRRDIPKQLYQ